MTECTFHAREIAARSALASAQNERELRTDELASCRQALAASEVVLASAEASLVALGDVDARIASEIAERMADHLTDGGSPPSLDPSPELAAAREAATKAQEQKDRGTAARDVLARRVTDAEVRLSSADDSLRSAIDALFRVEGDRLAARVEEAAAILEDADEHLKVLSEFRVLDRREQHPHYSRQADCVLSQDALKTACKNPDEVSKYGSDSRKQKRDIWQQYHRELYTNPIRISPINTEVKNG